MRTVFWCRQMQSGLLATFLQLPSPGGMSKSFLSVIPLRQLKPKCIPWHLIDLWWLVRNLMYLWLTQWWMDNFRNKHSFSSREKVVSGTSPAPVPDIYRQEVSMCFFVSMFTFNSKYLIIHGAQPSQTYSPKLLQCTIKRSKKGKQVSSTFTNFSISKPLSL